MSNDCGVILSNDCGIKATTTSIANKKILLFESDNKCAFLLEICHLYRPTDKKLGQSRLATFGGVADQYRDPCLHKCTAGNGIYNNV